ncbi:MAG: response regulator [Pseudomonadota bacterium]
MKQLNQLTLLVVDDDQVDRIIMTRALHSLRIANPVVFASDGLEALDYLRGTNGTTAIARPFIVLLDLNMPRMGGLEFLEAIRADPKLQSSIVFVLSTSDADEDIIKSYAYNVAGYFVKGDSQESMLAMVEMLNKYWNIVELPNRQH